MPSHKKAYHVVVIGDGITGLSTSYFLKKKGIKRLAVAKAASGVPISTRGSGFCSGGQIDNFTRISNSYNKETAAKLWQWGDRAFDTLIQFADIQKLKVMRSQRIRILVSSGEVEEAGEAVRQLSAFGLSGRICAQPSPSFGKRVKGIQTDGVRGAFLSPTLLSQSLHHLTTSIPRIPAIKSISSGNLCLNLEMENGDTVQTEVVVTASHLGTSSLIPELSSVLIPYADQWSELELKDDRLGDFWTPGTAFTCNHTHEWGVTIGTNKLNFGGCRYLRPLAGIEATYAEVDPKITEYFKKITIDTFGLKPNVELMVNSTFAFRDIRPCDELPLIGPMYGEPRILVATGFSGQGYQAPFYAGFSLANLIATGEAQELPRILWPDRLRSLKD